MPELPEVVTVVSTLQHQIYGKKIIGIDTYYDDIIVGDLVSFKSNLIGQHFNIFTHRGKYCVFGMDRGYLIVHLRMEGKFFIKPFNAVKDKHEHIIFHLDDIDLRYADTRKFGKMEYIPYPYDLANLHDLGLEPFDNLLTPQYLYNAIHNKRIAIKTLLMDQHIISGIGNIYSDEILFATSIHPLTKGCYITLEQCGDIIIASQSILRQAISLGGSTVRSYTSSLGVTGKFQNNVRVYGKNNCSCLNCGATIQRIVVNGRSACFCPKCQREVKS